MFWFHMPLKIWWLRSFVRAHLAFERAFSRMHSKMYSQSSSLCKRSTADAAREWAYTCMSSNMLKHVPALIKLSTTEGALILHHRSGLHIYTFHGKQIISVHFITDVARQKSLHYIWKNVLTNTVLIYGTLLYKNWQVLIFYVVPEASIETII